MNTSVYVLIWFGFGFWFCPDNTSLEYMRLHIFISSAANHKQSIAFVTIVSQNIALKSYPENKESEDSCYT